ncbi:MAG: hypothetical protein ACOZIN_08555 [Myxococcota bacterium]
MGWVDAIWSGAEAAWDVAQAYVLPGYTLPAAAAAGVVAELSDANREGREFSYANAAGNTVTQAAPGLVVAGEKAVDAAKKTGEAVKSLWASLWWVPWVAGGVVVVAGLFVAAPYVTPFLPRR